MDIVVILAFSVLVFVFLITLIFLIVTCHQRRKRDRASALPAFPNAPVRYTCENVGEITSMEHLDSVLCELLQNNQWLFEARGIMQHVVAVLTLTRTITQKLSGVEITPEPAYLKDVIVMVMRNIHPRFDDLIESLSAPAQVDIRILEARAMTLGTTAWSLYAPYAVLDPISCKRVLQPSCNEINVHLMTIRTAAQLSALSKNIEENMNLTDLKENLLRIRRQLRGEMMLGDEPEAEGERDDEYEDVDVDDDDDDNEHPEVLIHTIDHEKIPLVKSNEIIDMIEMTKVPMTEKEHLLMNGMAEMNGNGIANHQHHLHHHHHHHHHHQHPHHHMTNGSLNTVEESNEDDHHHEGTSTSCSSSSTSSSSSASSTSHPHDSKA